MTFDSCSLWETLWIVLAEHYSFFPSSVFLACGVISLCGTSDGNTDMNLRTLMLSDVEL